MKKYIVVYKDQLPEIEQEINKLLNEGWKLCGGISMAYKHEHSGQAHVPGHIVYAQAMEKTSD